ncbi:hypothetical protein [Streptomyces sp. AP-93]|uniref:hypothetical protein n=1 Tax=Streptomyces sp. AP-93 TaxID=2929048 RepID=UPI001FAEA009|nr:hypothetical protein [Streptomyces sp. AP-93]MCJ0874325.1 hypothetical protein [Streptomyces sp. AP-93]
MRRGDLTDEQWARLEPLLLCWALTADDREREALLGLAEDCPGATVAYEPVAFATTK